VRYVAPPSRRVDSFCGFPDEKNFAVTNLYDGIDSYSLESNHLMDASFQRSIAS
jgi:hypothetical protein